MTVKEAEAEAECVMDSLLHLNAAESIPIETVGEWEWMMDGWLIASMSCGRRLRQRKDDADNGKRKKGHEKGA